MVTAKLFVYNYVIRGHAGGGGRGPGFPPPSFRGKIMNLVKNISKNEKFFNWKKVVG